MDVKTCAYCGQLFESSARRRDAIFCGTRCARAAAKYRHRLRNGYKPKRIPVDPDIAAGKARPLTRRIPQNA